MNSASSAISLSFRSLSARCYRWTERLTETGRDSPMHLDVSLPIDRDLDDSPLELGRIGEFVQVAHEEVAEAVERGDLRHADPQGRPEDRLEFVPLDLLGL